MKQVMHIPIWRTFLNWVIALVIGSILWPLIAGIFENGPKQFEEMGGVMLISMILGGLTSLPAMLLLLLTNWQLNKHELSSGSYIRTHILVHILVAILTFFVIYLFVSRDIGRSMFLYIVLASSYILTGIGTWSVTFMIYKRKALEKPERRDDILDEQLD
jgi:hypothetical protein